MSIPPKFENTSQIINQGAVPMNETCPHCGSEMNEAGNYETLDIEFNSTTQIVTAGDRSCKLTPMLVHILEVFLDEYPKPVTAEQIHAEIYADRDLEKQPALDTVRLRITHMRAAFARARMPFEIHRVTGRHGQPAGYVLTSVDAPNRQTPQQSVA
jgi:DNA-binding response OmpR family regulator